MIRWLIFAIALTSCHPRSALLEPSLCYDPHPWDLSGLLSAFPPLNDEELSSDWGKEFRLAIHFANDFDLYRSITAFKRALYITPLENKERRAQLEYSILFSYYMGKRYIEVIGTFEGSSLASVSSNFPAFRDLVLILFDAYQQLGECEKAEAIFKIIERGDEELGEQLITWTHIKTGILSERNPLAKDYCRCKKNVATAQALNAIVPGMGYYYVGQRKTALTALLVNALTTAAAWHFYNDGNWGAGTLLASLEMGWYFGGINGAGLAAKTYNERFYNQIGNERGIHQRFFPALMLETRW